MLGLVDQPGPVTVNPFTHANSPACPGDGDKGCYIYTEERTLLSYITSQLDETTLSNSTSRGKSVDGMVKNHKDVSVVGPPSFKCDCKMQE